MSPNYFINLMFKSYMSNFQLFSISLSSAADPKKTLATEYPMYIPDINIQLDLSIGLYKQSSFLKCASLCSTVFFVI